MKNLKFKADDYISLEVGLEKRSGDPFRLGTLVGVCMTGSGSADPIDNVLGSPTYNGDKQNGVGNAPGWASVVLAGGAEVNIPSGLRAGLAVGDTLYIATDGTLTKTNTDQRFGKVTHLQPAGDNTTAIVKIVQ